MNPSPDPDPEQLAKIFDLPVGESDPLVDRFLAEAAVPAEDAAGAERALQELGQALPTPSLALRVSVAVVAVAQLLVVLPWLLGRDPVGLLGDSTGAHLTRDGSLGLVVAVAALLAAWRPHWSRPSFAVGSVAVVAQAAASTLDDTVATGGNELIHLPSVALVCLTGALAINLTDLAPRKRRLR